MKWIVSTYERNEQLDEFRVLAWSLDHPEIEFQWSKNHIINSINSGKEFKTAYLEKNKYVEGSNVIVIENEDGSQELRTKKNDLIVDNLGELPKFES